MMKSPETSRRFLCRRLAVAAFSTLSTLAIAASLAIGQESTPPKQPPQAAAALARLTIEVTGGPDNVAVENASVYIRYKEGRKLRRDKKIELSVKTNHEGIAHVPEMEIGTVLIQIVADGWKTFGHSFDINDPKQTIKIHLDRPPKWY